MNKLRTLADVLRQAGFARITGLFLIFYLLCSTAVWLSEPTTPTFGDGLWFSFETVSTIGFGDIPAETPVARAITVVLSVISIFYIAMLTGVAVNYCNTLIKLRQKDTMARFMDDLEHLEELDRDELADLSRRRARVSSTPALERAPRVTMRGTEYEYHRVSGCQCRQ